MPTGIYKRTKEHKEKMSKIMSERMMGNSIWKDKKHSQETKNKISESNKGKHFYSKEIIEKIRKGNTGKKPSIETRKKMSEYRKSNPIKYWKDKKNPYITGNKNHFFGKKGENHPKWKGGVTPENQRIRHSSEMKLWKKTCLERDNYIDQKTGIRGGDLVVHHINNFSDFPELRTLPSNGITLSKESHEEFHKLYDRKNNTKEQLIEFLN
jgi:hypothetical protein